MFIHNPVFCSAILGEVIEDEPLRVQGKAPKSPLSIANTESEHSRYLFSQDNALRDDEKTKYSPLVD